MNPSSFIMLEITIGQNVIILYREAIIFMLEKLSPLCVLDLVHVILFIELNYCCFIYLLWSDIMMLLGLLMYLNS